MGLISNTKKSIKKNADLALLIKANFLGVFLFSLSTPNSFSFIKKVSIQQTLFLASQWRFIVVCQGFLPQDMQATTTFNIFQTTYPLPETSNSPLKLGPARKQEAGSSPNHLLGLWSVIPGASHFLCGFAKERTI